MNSVPMSDVGDRVCDLECVKKSNRHEFVGPVKIVLIEPSTGEYLRKSWGAAFLSFSMLLMGATVFTVFFFTLSFKLPFIENLHVLLCTMGFQLFMPAGIMMVNQLFGGSAQLKPLDRKCQHLFLQVSAIGCGITGSVFMVLFGSKNFVTIHGVSGLLAGGLMLCSALVGPINFFSDRATAFGRFTKTFHTVIAVPCLLASTVSFVLGLLKDSFNVWAPTPNLHYILIVFSIIYTLLILIAMCFSSTAKVE